MINSVLEGGYEPPTSPALYGARSAFGVLEQILSSGGVRGSIPTAEAASATTLVPERMEGTRGIAPRFPAPVAGVLLTKLGPLAPSPGNEPGPPTVTIVGLSC